ncbi:pirin family protein [Amphritea japonica]|uniref:pirin family protein n=1 Tax=Amphritea japonica TaxID=452627 RepID=UPI00036C7A99|nr:pirin family protein [Amphritea japonica]
MALFETKITSKSEQVGNLIVNRVMPQQKLTPVGYWVLLDHFDQFITPDSLPKPDGTFAHPHRGISTLTYLIQGEITHLDSRAHQGHVGSGGVQWMKSGNGIVHDEWAKPVQGRFVGAQFWLNLSSKEKGERPDYRAVQNEELPKRNLKSSQGYLKVIVGEYEGLTSPIATESRQLLLHLHLDAGDTININLVKSDQYAVYVASGLVDISGESLQANQQGFLSDNLSAVNIVASEETDLFLYGGEAYLETIIPRGPFIMNTQKEIFTAFNDYQKGKYGDINYSAIE